MVRPRSKALFKAARIKGPAALILLAHGSRSRKTLEEMRVLAKRVASAQRGWRVQGAWLSLARPDLAGAIAAAVKGGAREIRVLPMFLFTGKHAGADVPALVRALRARHPGVALKLLPALGRHRGLADLIRLAAFS